MKKKRFYLLLFVIAILCIGETAFAKQPINCEVQPRGMCLECGGFTDYKCRDVVVRSDTGTHKCGAFWADTCTVVYEYCYSDLTCNFCGDVTERNLGPHLCREVHSKCDLGSYKVCPCGSWPS